MTITINTVDGKTFRLEKELAEQAEIQLKTGCKIISVANESIEITVYGNYITSYTISKD